MKLVRACSSGTAAAIVVVGVEVEEGDFDVERERGDESRRVCLLFCWCRCPSSFHTQAALHAVIADACVDARGVW